MRIVGTLVLAIAAVSALMLGTGVSAPPHRVAPGTPLNHTLVLGAYRFAFLIEPVTETHQMTPEMAALHKALALAGMPMTDMPGMAGVSADLVPIFATSGLNPGQDLAVALALLVILWPRLPRPTLRQIADMSPHITIFSQYRAPMTIGPPRS